MPTSGGRGQGMADAWLKLPHADICMPYDAADSGDEPSDQEQEGSQPVVDDGVPEQQRHRIVRGRGRGRTPFGAFGRGRR